MLGVRLCSKSWDSNHGRSWPVVEYMVPEQRLLVLVSMKHVASDSRGLHPDAAERKYPGKAFGTMTSLGGSYDKL